MTKSATIIFSSILHSELSPKHIGVKAMRHIRTSVEAGAKAAAEATRRAETTAVNFIVDVCIEYYEELDYGLGLELRQDDV